MGKLHKRLTELEKRQRDIMIQLEKLDEIVTKRLVMRELTDVKMRIRNLRKNSKKITSLKCIVPEDDAVNVVAEEDDYFDPELVELNTTRPEMRIYPKTPLPHSQPFWPRVVRVARGWPDVPLSKEFGQFTGVEEEDEDGRLMWQGEESETSYYNKDDDDDNNNTKDGGCFQGFTALDHLSPLFEVKDIPAEDAAVLIGHDGRSGINDKEKELAQLKNLFSLDKIAAAFETQSFSETDISTDQSGDSDDIPEYEKDEEVFTKIKGRVDEEMIRKVKAMVVQNTQDNSKSFLNQKTSRSSWSGSHSRSTTVPQSSFKSELDINIVKKDEEGTLSQGSSATIVTIRAKLASSNLHNSCLKVSASDSESLLKEKLKKRLIS